MTRTARRLLPVAVAVAVLAPLLRAPESDSYPLSTYPMFAVNRGATAVVSTAVGVTADGAIRRLSPEIIGGSDEVILAAATVSDAIRRGETVELCREIAARVRGSDLVEVVVRAETIDVVEHIASATDPLAVDEIERCVIP